MYEIVVLGWELATIKGACQERLQGEGPMGKTNG
jgi:hypothetical protein